MGQEKLDNFVRALRMNANSKNLEKLIAGAIGEELTQMGKDEIELNLVGRTVLEWMVNKVQVEAAGEEVMPLDKYIKIKHPWIATFLKDLRE